MDGFVKSFIGKAHKSRGTSRTEMYVAVTSDAVQRRIWTFYEVALIK
jgi:hypothetical protein